MQLLASVLNITLHFLNKLSAKTASESLSLQLCKHFLEYVDAAQDEKARVRPLEPFSKESSILYLWGSSLAEKSLLCLDRYWILALGADPDAQSGHIGSWLPQITFSLIKKNMKSLEKGAEMMMKLVEKKDVVFEGTWGYGKHHDTGVSLQCFVIL